MNYCDTCQHLFQINDPKHDYACEEIKKYVESHTPTFIFIKEPNNFRCNLWEEKK